MAAHEAQLLLGNNMQLYSTMYDCVTGADMFSTFLCMVHIGQVSVSMQPKQVMQWVLDVS